MSSNLQKQEIEIHVKNLTNNLRRVRREERSILKQLSEYKIRLCRISRASIKMNKLARGRNNVKTEEQAVFFERAYTSKFKPKVGHTVRILEPRLGRNERGQIVGFCKNSNVKIQTDENLPNIIRSPKNIVNSNEGIRFDDFSRGKKTVHTFVPRKFKSL